MCRSHDPAPVPSVCLGVCFHPRAWTRAAVHASLKPPRTNWFSLNRKAKINFSEEQKRWLTFQFDLFFISLGWLFLCFLCKSPVFYFFFFFFYISSRCNQLFSKVRMRWLMPQNISPKPQIWQQQLGPALVHSDLLPPESGQWGRGGEGSHASLERENVLTGSSPLQPALVFLSQLCPPWGNAVHFAGPPGWADQSLPIWGGEAGMVRLLQNSLLTSFWEHLPPHSFGSFALWVHKYICFAEWEKYL